MNKLRKFVLSKFFIPIVSIAYLGGFLVIFLRFGKAAGVWSIVVFGTYFLGFFLGYWIRGKSDAELRKPI